MITILAIKLQKVFVKGNKSGEKYNLGRAGSGAFLAGNGRQEWEASFFSRLKDRKAPSGSKVTSACVPPKLFLGSGEGAAKRS